MKVIEDQYLLSSALIRLTLKLGYKPRLSTVAEYLSLSSEYTHNLLKRYNIEDIINLDMGSKFEDDIYNFVKSRTDKLGLTVIRHDRNILGGLELDIFIPELKLAIEANGVYWHSSTYKDIYYHQDKTLLCNSKGIRLIHIFEYEWNDADIQQKLINLLDDIIDNKHVSTIYARKCGIIELSPKDSLEFLNQYHLQNYITSDIAYGLYQNNDILGIMSFGRPRFSSNYDFEVYRLCWKSGIRVLGGTSKLFHHFLSTLHPSTIVTFSDASKFTGNIYNQLGFKLLGLTYPNYKWINDELTVKSRYQTMKQNLTDQGLGTKDDTEDGIMERLGYYKLYDCGSYKFEYREGEVY